MIAPLAAHGVVGDTGTLVLAFAIGIGFGWALERAGLGSARKLMGQFYLTDFTVFKVMFTAILTAMLGTFWLARLGILDLDALYVPETFIAPQLAGGIVFGIGFALAGLCPGTSCVAAATGRGDGLAVVTGMLTGVTVTGLAFDRLERFYSSGARGAFTLPQLLHVPTGVVMLGVVAIAVLGFWATNLLATRQSPIGNGQSPVAARHPAMAVVALALAIGAATVGNPSAAAPSIERIHPLQLAEWIRDRQPGLRVIDLRSEAAFDDYHVPTADRHPVRSLERLPWTRDQVVVFYSDDDAEAMEGARALNGRVRVCVLDGGAAAWIADVMSPALAAGASDEERAAFAKTSELSRYFGGTPRVGVNPGERQSAPAARAVQQVRRRGC